MQSYWLLRQVENIFTTKLEKLKHLVENGADSIQHSQHRVEQRTGGSTYCIDAI
jgi:hypothetical protein